MDRQVESQAEGTAWAITKLGPGFPKVQFSVSGLPTQHTTVSPTTTRCIANYLLLTMKYSQAWKVSGYF